MRNCFVPHCDAFCKKNGILKRMMFSAPKDNFEKWKNKLFNKREFRETDRVCERHFDKTQILTHWEHIIDGRICQLEREKPKIRPDAVPYLNLPNTETIITTISKKRDAKPKSEPRKRKQYNVNSLHNEKIMKEETELEDGYTFSVSDVHNSKKQNEQAAIVHVKAKDVKRPSDDEKRQIFDAVYDEICDVVLPNTLWGFHRDPDRKFIGFSKMHKTNTICTTYVKVTDAFNLDVHVDGLHHTNELIGELSVDVLSKFLNELNEKSERV